MRGTLQPRSPDRMAASAIDLAGQVVRTVERGGPAREPGEQVVQLRPEPRVVADRVVRGLELLERADQRLGHVAPAEVALLAPAAEGVDLEQAGVDGRRAERRVGPVAAGVAGTLGEERDARAGPCAAARRRRAARSVPEATSTPMAGTARTASATLAGSRPPARMTGTSRATAAASAVSTRRPVPPGMRPAGGVEQDPRRRPRARNARARETTSSGAASEAPTPERLPRGATGGRDRRRRLVAVELDHVRVHGRAPPRRDPSAGRSAVTTTICGRASPAAAAARPGRRARPPPRSTGPAACPGAKLRPMASAPARTAASRPASSVTPQILTMGARAAAAGSRGYAPAATNAAAAAAGSAERISASPTRAPSKPLARQRAMVAASRTPDSAIDQAVTRARGPASGRPAPGPRPASAGRGC